MVYRSPKDDNFTTMSNCHLQDKRLSLKTKGLLSVMLSLPDDWNFSAKGLATLSPDSDEMVNQSLKELEKYGYLKRTPVRVKGVIRDWNYDIYEVPQTLENITSSPLRDLPQMAEPQMVTPQMAEPQQASPFMVKQPQQNTNIQNTNKLNNNSANAELGQSSIPHSQSSYPKRRVLVSTDNPVSEHKKKNKYQNCMDITDEMFDDVELRKILSVYLPVRLAMRDKPIFANGWRNLLEKLRDMSSDNATRVKIVQQSIDNGWAKFVELKPYYGNYNKRQKFAEGKNGLKLGRNEDEEIINETF